MNTNDLEWLSRVSGTNERAPVHASVPSNPMLYTAPGVLRLVLEVCVLTGVLVLLVSLAVQSVLIRPQPDRYLGYLLLAVLVICFLTCLVGGKLISGRYRLTTFGTLGIVLLSQLVWLALTLVYFASSAFLFVIPALAVPVLCPEVAAVWLGSSAVGGMFGGYLSEARRGLYEHRNA